jgi:hypothetical protein
MRLSCLYPPDPEGLWPDLPISKHASAAGRSDAVPSSNFFRKKLMKKLMKKLINWSRFALAALALCGTAGLTTAAELVIG